MAVIQTVTVSARCAAVCLASANQRGVFVKIFMKISVIGLDSQTNRDVSSLIFES